MVGLGTLMALLGLVSLIMRIGGRIYSSDLLHRAAIVMGPSGFVAVLAGWVTTEVGRQPYTIYGLLRTVDSVSPIGLPGVSASLVAFVIVYFIVFGAGVFYLLRLMGKTPGATATPEPETPMRSAGLMPGPAQHVGQTTQRMGE